MCKNFTVESCNITVKYPSHLFFGLCVSQILRVLNESAVAIRTKAMKSLSAVISADPSILSRVSVFVINKAILQSNNIF